MKTEQKILFLQNRLAYLQDEGAYKSLFFHFHPILLKFVHTIVNNKDDAEDIVSEVLLKLWTMGSALNYIENLTLYLFKAARNKAYDFLRKKERDIVTEPISNGEYVSADEDHPEQLYISNELDRHIQNAVSSLSTQCQLVFRLIKEQGFTYKQVTETLEISQNTAETHMRLALKKLRLALGDYLAGKK